MVGKRTTTEYSTEYVYHHHGQTIFFVSMPAVLGQIGGEAGADPGIGRGGGGGGGTGEGVAGGGAKLEAESPRGGCGRGAPLPPS